MPQALSDVNLPATLWLTHQLDTRGVADTVAAEGGCRQTQLAGGAARPGPAGSGAPGDRLPVAGDIVGRRYQLIELLGQGAFGRVYLAERTDVREHRVALKILKRAVYAGRNVDRELEMLAAANHPHVVSLKDHGVTDDWVWFTMPKYEGETLAARLERGLLSLAEAHAVFTPIARGLHALHAAGLRHQDVKPENIFLARFAGQLHPILLDLGVAVERDSSFVAGTMLYGAPEQVIALGVAPEEGGLDESMDVYCLAATVLRSLVGPGFYPGETAQTPVELAQAFARRETTPLAAGALPLLTGQPRRLLQEAFQRWLATEPRRRPAAHELAEQLGVLLERERAEERLAARKIARQRASLQRIRIAAGGMLLIGLGVLAYGYSKRETLQLAAELDQVRAQGAASFDKLDTCVAAHELSLREVDSCRARRRSDAAAFSQTLQDEQQTATAERRGLLDRLTRQQTKLHTCEDSARRDAEAWTKEKKELTSTWEQQQDEWSDRRQALEKERDAQQRGLSACEQRVSSLEPSWAECRQDLATCIEDRDACQAAPEPPPPVAATPAPDAPGETKPPPPAPVQEKQPAASRAPAAPR